MTFLSFLSSCTRITAQLCIRDDTIGYFTWHVKRYIVNTLIQGQKKLSGQNQAQNDL